ncbi:amino acid ABC transporter substrate-binding protein/permease [Listeria monocytogenes]|uniref:amino acid ABC transporter substrate-binding protein/permease n=1 Tax=Listeria monocytogenes TaxID=1639 RepID=UPI0012F373BD|nr:ABC transporter permease subunit [Listeria monocytogenes]EAW7142316.1 ABC transporter permease subunit [Listeria monocytogenes]ECR1113670.1 ABC transporter permease subunit [Listeria monocytogenes]EIM0219774.1 amino acid ABC transporter substrate-binding protein/permease [Listeria monocytogenes]EIM0406719.1 amino acid ABC transporter substrate-binding protein/permease [Listeria monocytogenes]
MKKFSRFILMMAIACVAAFIFTGNGLNAKAAEETYLIGTDTTFAPFEFEKDGEHVGIDMDILKAIAKDQNFKYEIKAMGFNAAVQALEANQVDGVIAGMSITDERKQKFNFSDPYFDSGVVMGILKDNDEIKTYDDLKGKKVAVKTGTEGYAFAEKIKDKYDFDIVVFDDSAQMYDDVKTRNSVACFDDYPVLAYGVQTGNGLKIVTDKEKGNSYGFAVNKGKNQELLEKFNAGLVNIKASGEYDKILENYLGDNAIKENTNEKGFMGIIKSSWPALLSGLWLTIRLAVVSLIIAFIIGITFGFMKVSNSKILRGIATVYVDIFRGTPLIVQAFFFYFGIPAALDFRMPVFLAGVIALSLNAGAYMVEIVRGGIQSVDKGQMEAARSLGLPHKKAMMKVVLPQAIRMMIPSFINQFVITLKDTSIMSAIGLVELTQSGKIIMARTFESTWTWLIIGIMYLIVITILTKISDRLERRLRND